MHHADEKPGDLRPPAHSNHEHPTPYTPRRFVDDAAFDASYGAFRMDADEFPMPGGHPIRRAGRTLRVFEAAVDAAREVSFGGEAGVLAAALAELSALSPGNAEGKVRERRMSSDSEGCPHEEVVQPPSADWGRMYSLAPVIDLLAGLTYMRDGDSEAAAAGARGALASVEEAAGAIERCLAAMSRSDTGSNYEGQRIALAAAASELPTRLTAAAFSAADECVDHWAAENPVSMLIQRTREISLNGGIRAVEPSEVEPGGEVSIWPLDAFPETQPEDVAVFTEDGREPAEVVRWDAQQVVVKVGPRAQSGHVFFGPALADSDDPVATCLRNWKRAYADEWQMTMFPLLRRNGPRRPAYCNPTADNHIKIERPPLFATVNLLDAFGVVLEDRQHAARGQPPYSLEWRVHFPRPGTSVRLIQGNRVLARGLPPLGSHPVFASLYELPELSVAVEEDGDADEKLDHRQLWDEPVSDVIPVFVEPRLEALGWVDLDFEPRSLHLGVPSTADDASGLPFSFAEVRMALRDPTPEPLTLMIKSSDSRVSVDRNQLVIPAGGQSALVTVSARGYDRDRPEQPCATIAVEGSDDRFSYGGKVEVWVEPQEGKWELVGQVGEVDPDSPGDPVRLPGDQLGIVGIHAALLENGKILFFAPPKPWAEINDQTKVDAELWDWRTRRVDALDARPPESFRQRNLFCAGHVHLPDGRLLIAGGHSAFPQDPSTDWFVHAYDPSQRLDRRWTRHGRMMEPRWYPTLLALPDGRVLIVSGSSHGAYFYASRGAVGGFRISAFGYYGWLPQNYGYGPTPLWEAGSATAIDVFDPQGGLVRFPGRFLDANQDTYPFMAVLPSGPHAPHGATLTVERDRGHIHQIDPTSPTSPVTPVATYTCIFRSRRTYPTYGTGVLLPLDADAKQARYLVVGGGNDVDPRLSVTSRATNTVELFQYDAARPLDNQPGFRGAGQFLAARRFMSDAVLLADGNVLICGGAAVGTTNENEQPVKLAELFDTTTERLRPMDVAHIERRYHATHLLLPDGTVQASGSTGGMGFKEVLSYKRRVEIFRPPYLWRGARPVIASAPAALPYASSVTIGSPQARDLASVALVRLGSVTHGNNMDQRYVRLPITSRSVGEPDHTRDAVTASTPRDGSIAPAGPYMLFLLDQRGVPSNGQMVRVGVPGAAIEPPVEPSECAAIRAEIQQRQSRVLELFASMEGLDPQDEQDRAEIAQIQAQADLVDSEIAERQARAASLGCRA
jgi:hypothetical protein